MAQVNPTSPVPAFRVSFVRLQCSACGAEAQASWNCGKLYVPARQRAAEAIAANPQKSNRAIADDIGVSEPTVRRARDATASPDAVEERTGRDGKKRRLPSYIPEPQGPGMLEPAWDDIIDQIIELSRQLPPNDQVRCNVKLRKIYRGDT